MRCPISIKTQIYAIDAIIVTFWAPQNILQKLDSNQLTDASLSQMAHLHTYTFNKITGRCTR